MNFATFTIIYAKTVMCTLLIPAGMYLAYVSPIHSIFLWWKSWYEADGIHLFIKFGNFSTFAIIYAKTVMCTLPIPAKITTKFLGICFCNIKYFSYGRNRGRRCAVSISLKNSVILQLSQLFMQKPWRVPFQFQLECIWHRFLQYTVFFYGENRGTKPTASIYL